MSKTHKWLMWRREMVVYGTFQSQIYNHTAESFGMLVRQVNWLNTTTIAFESVKTNMCTRAFHSEPESITMPFEHLWIEHRYLFLGSFGTSSVTRNEWKIILNIAVCLKFRYEGFCNSKINSMPLKTSIFTDVTENSNRLIPKNV